MEIPADASFKKDDLKENAYRQNTRHRSLDMAYMRCYTKIRINIVKYQPFTSSDRLQLGAAHTWKGGVDGGGEA